MSDRPEYEDPLGRTMFEQDNADGTVDVSPAPGQWVCDFCLTPDPTWTYPCGPVMLAGPHMEGSADDWAACDHCHELIEAENWPALVEHVVKTQREQPIAPDFVNLPPVISTMLVSANLEAFRSARSGPPRRGQ